MLGKFLGCTHFQQFLKSSNIISTGNIFEHGSVADLNINSTFLLEKSNRYKIIRKLYVGAVMISLMSVSDALSSSNFREKIEGK